VLYIKNKVYINLVVVVAVVGGVAVMVVVVVVIVVCCIVGVVVFNVFVRQNVSAIVFNLTKGRRTKFCIFFMFPKFIPGVVLMVTYVCVKFSAASQISEFGKFLGVVLKLNAFGSVNFFF